MQIIPLLMQTVLDIVYIMQLSCIFQFPVHVFIDQKMEWKIGISTGIFGILVFQNSGSQFGVPENGTFFVGKSEKIHLSIVVRLPGYISMRI